MGMYDTIKIKLHCIWCGVEIDDWQTKDLSNTLEVFNIDELKKMRENQPELFRKMFPEIDKHRWIEIHNICDKCKKFISIQLDL